LARSSAPKLGANGLGVLGGALTAGILVGYVFVVPGLGTVSIAGLLDIPLATMLGYGLIIGTVTVLITVFIYSLLVRVGLWNPEKDEHVSEALLEALAAERMGESDDAEDSLAGGCRRCSSRCYRFSCRR
jgi:GntP family gluconate:H+ symporter